MLSPFVRFRVRPIAFGALLAAMLCVAAGPAAAADPPAKGGVAAVQKSPQAPPPGPPPALPSAATDSPPAPADDSATADERDDPFPFGRHRGGLQIDDFDSFKQAMDVAPWIVGVVFLVLGSIFLTPIILLVGIIWYKLRKTRLQNEAVLKLAERGVMPSAQAVDAVMAGTPPAQAVPAAVAAAVPMAVASRRRAVWSDLRKGVLLAAVGWRWRSNRILMPVKPTGWVWYCFSSAPVTSPYGGWKTGIWSVASAPATTTVERGRAYAGRQYRCRPPRSATRS